MRSFSLSSMRHYAIFIIVGLAVAIAIAAFAYFIINSAVALAASTKFIRDDTTGGDCATIGNWDSATKTCTLNTDVFETIQVESNGITLDGNGHKITGGGIGVFLVGISGATVRNLTVSGFNLGIRSYNSNNNNFFNNNVSYNGTGLYFSESNHNTIQNNTASNNTYVGIYLDSLSSNNHDNNISSNTFSNNGSGGAIDSGIFIATYGGRNSSNNTIDSNTINYNSRGGGILLAGSGNLTNYTITNNDIEGNSGQGLNVLSTFSGVIYHNDIINNANPPSVFPPTANIIFSQSLPIGGNHWSEYYTPVQGCIDSNNDGICDSPFVFTGGQDNFPFVKRDGWKTKKMLNPTDGGKIIQLFSTSTDQEIRHLGIDIDHTIDGTPVHAAAGGKIVRIVTSTDPALPAWGKWAWVFHGDVSELDGTTAQKISTLYLHLDNVSSSLAAGDMISAGTALGVVNSTGIIEGPHLHFSVRQGDILVGATSTINTTTTLLNPLEFVDYALSSRYFSVTVKSTVDIVLTDPDGLAVSKQINELGGGAGYSEVKFVADSSAASRDEGLTDYDSVEVDERKDGDYLIRIIPEAGALPTDVYSLFVSTPSTTIVLIENVPIKDLPDQPYIIRSSATTTEKVIPAKVRIKLETLNLSSGGTVRAFVQIDRGFGATVRDIDPNTVTLAGAKAVRISIEREEKIIDKSRNNNGDDGDKDDDKDKLPTLVAKFRVRDFVGIPTGRKVPIFFNGKLFDGTSVEGTDTVRVLSRKSAEIGELIHLLANLQLVLQGLSNILGTWSP